MAVITMTREMGSLGKDVARGVADELGLLLVQHEIVEHVADKMRMGRSEVNRFLEGHAGLLERWGVDQEALSLYTAEEIIELAEQSSVMIRGWGACHLLRPIRHVASVRIWAAMDFRVGVLLDRLEIDDQEFAREEIKKNDAAHARAMQRVFHVNDWEDPALYDLTLDTSRVGVAECIEHVKRLVQSPAFQETAESRARLVALKLEVRVRTTLKEHRELATASRALCLVVGPECDSVTLRGGVYREADRRALEQLVAQVPGVRTVNNELRAMKLDG